jgi:hypothetical protein
MPITQDAHNALARAADRAMKVLEAFIEGVQGDINAGLTGPALIDKLLLRISAIPRMMEERDLVTKALDRYKFTAHSNRRRAAKHRAARGALAPGDAPFIAPRRYTPREKIDTAVNNALASGLSREEMNTIDPKSLVAWYGPGSPGDKRLAPGESITTADGTIISEIAPTKPPIDQAELNKILDNAARMLAQPINMPQGHVPDLLSRIPRAPDRSQDAATEQAIENGGGED